MQKAIYHNAIDGLFSHQTYVPYVTYIFSMISPPAFIASMLSGIRLW